MNLEVMKGIAKIHDCYRQWELGGREDEYLGAALLDQLKERLSTFIPLDGNLISLKIAKGGSGLELTVLRGN